MVGIVAAMDEELAAVIEMIAARETTTIGGRAFHRADKHVAVVSRIGKVAAAATTAILIERYKPEAIVMIGLAGAIDPSLRVGDVVVADRLVQHDLDARPLFPRHEMPGLGRGELVPDRALSDRLAAGARDYRVVRGMIATGDRFFSHADHVEDLRAILPDAKAVEMEGAAIAQVCHEHDVPFAVARVISDTADHSAAVSFAEFLANHCRAYTRALIRDFL